MIFSGIYIGDITTFEVVRTISEFSDIILKIWRNTRISSKIHYYSCIFLGSHLHLQYYHHLNKNCLNCIFFHLLKFLSRWRHRERPWRHLEFQLAHREILLQFSRWATGKSSWSSRKTVLERLKLDGLEQEDHLQLKIFELKYEEMD